MNRIRHFILICVLLIFLIFPLTFTLNLESFEVTHVPSPCVKQKLRRNASQVDETFHLFILSRKENFFTAKCEANYPVEMIVDSGELDKKTLMKVWIQTKPCGPKGEKTFTSQYNKSYEPNEKFTMGFSCVPQCGGIECAERVRLVHSGDNFITLKSNAILWSSKTNVYAELDAVNKVRFTHAETDFKFSPWKEFLIMALAVSYILCCLFTLCFIRDLEIQKF